MKPIRVTKDHDSISRQAAIEALGEKPLAWVEGEYELGLQNQWERDVNAITELQSVELTPCDLCKYGPPGSEDGKPCSVCPAEGRR